jgi:RNA polymerase sigma-70 factor (ECF subfamily)
LKSCKRRIRELFKNIEKFEINRYPDILSALKGWFKRILVNTCIDHYRKYSHLNRNHGLAEETENIPDHGATGIDTLSYKELIEAIRMLSPGYRTVFNLFVIDGLSHEEISKQIGITVGASKSNLSKARENLKKIIQKKIQFKAYA